MSQDTITLTLEPREVVGKRLRSLRLAGQVPAVIHDHGKDSLVVQGYYGEVQKTCSRAGKHHIVTLKIGDRQHNAIIKDISLDPRKNTITHVVFNAVKANEKIETDVPIHVKFADPEAESTPAERTGLILLTNAETVTIEALPKDLPDALYYYGDNLKEAGDQVTAAELELPKGVVLLTEESHVLATVFEPSSLAAANDAAGGDAEAGDEATVESDTESTAEVGTQAEEKKPGGKDQKEPKQSNVDANK